VRTVEADLQRSQEAQQQAQSDAFFAGAGTDAGRAMKSMRWICKKQGNVVRPGEAFRGKKIQLEEERGQLETRLPGICRQRRSGKKIERGRRSAARLRRRQARLREIQAGIDRADAGPGWQIATTGGRKRSRLNGAWNNCNPSTRASALAPWAALKNAEQVLGSLADKIRVPDQYIAAIEDRPGSSSATGHHRTAGGGARRNPRGPERQIKKGRACIASLSLGGAEETRPRSHLPGRIPRH